MNRGGEFYEAAQYPHLFFARKECEVVSRSCVKAREAWSFVKKWGILRSYIKLRTHN